MFREHDVRAGEIFAHPLARALLLPLHEIGRREDTVDDDALDPELGDLRTDRLHLLLVHVPDDGPVDLEAAVDAGGVFADDGAEVSRPVDAGGDVAGEGTGETDDGDGGETVLVFLDDGVDEVLQNDMCEYTVMR